MTPLAPAAIQARRRPWAIVHVYLIELLFALVVATPLHAWVARVWGAHPDGDAMLWEPGGHGIVAWFGRADTSLSVVSRTTFVLFVVSAVAMLVPQGALLASLAFSRGREPLDDPDAEAPNRSLRWQAALRVGVSAFTPLGALLVLSSLVTILLVAIGSVLGSAAEHAFEPRLGAMNAFYARLLVTGAFAALAAVLGVVADLARAAIARETALHVSTNVVATGWFVFRRGLVVALRTARRISLVRASAAWAVRAGLGLALVAVGYLAASVLGGRGGSMLVVLWAVHQLVVLGRVALRASWLARALAFVAPVQDVGATTRPEREERQDERGTRSERAQDAARASDAQPFSAR